MQNVQEIWRNDLKKSSNKPSYELLNKITEFTTTARHLFGSCLNFQFQSDKSQSFETFIRHNLFGISTQTLDLLWRRWWEAGAGFQICIHQTSFKTCISRSVLQQQQLVNEHITIAKNCSLIGHFTIIIVRLVTSPMTAREARGDLALIQTYLLAN